MKIITSVAGGGKTTKAIELAAQCVKEGKSVHFISGELSVEDFGLIAHEKGASSSTIEKIRFTLLSKDMNALGIANEDSADVLFLDGIKRHLFNEDGLSEVDWSHILKNLKDIEQKKNARIYVTIQANQGNKLARTPIVSEYIS